MKLIDGVRRLHYESKRSHWPFARASELCLVAALGTRQRCDSGGGTAAQHDTDHQTTLDLEALQKRVSQHDRPPDKRRQDAGAGRIQGADVADLLAAEEIPHLPERAERGDPGGLV